MGAPIDRTAKTAMDLNLVNGTTSDAPKLKASDSVLYDYVDGLNSAQDTHAQATTLAHPDGSVKTAKIADGAVTTPKLADGAVTTPKIPDGAVTAPKIPDGILTASKFVPGVLTNETANGLQIVALQAETATKLINAVTMFGAIGDGVTDNSASFATLSAYVNASSEYLAVFLPTGHYKYSSGLVFTKAVFVFGYGSVLHYTGTGKAMKLGADGLTSVNYDYGEYIIQGIKFTGGESMSHGIYFNNFVTMSRIIYCKFENFGNSNAWGIYYQCNNWDALVQGSSYYTNNNNVSGRHWVFVNGCSEDGITSDFGNSRLRMIGCLGTPQAGTSIGVFLNGANNEIADCKLEGFSPAIRLGAWSNRSRIVNTYFEASGSSLIQFGSPTGRPSSESITAFPNEVTIENCFANMHNSDFAPNSYFLAPTTASSGITKCRVVNNDIVNVLSGREIVLLNDISSQIDNVAYGNGDTFIKLTTEGANISPWYGSKAQGIVSADNMSDQGMYNRFKAGRTAKQYVGLQLVDYLSQIMGQWDVSPFNYMQIFNNGNLVFQVDPSGNSTIGGTIVPSASARLAVNGIMNASSFGFNSKTQKIYTGTGTPEGSITATVGSLYLRDDGGASTTLYVKQSGTGNTGWIAK